MTWSFRRDDGAQILSGIGYWLRLDAAQQRPLNRATGPCAHVHIYRDETGNLVAWIRNTGDDRTMILEYATSEEGLDHERLHI